MSKKVLIVEDNAQMRFLEREILEERGYEVLESATSKDGIDLAVEKVPDIILMDVRLPSKKRGIGAAKALRKIDKTRDIPIIFVTGYADGEGSPEIKSITNCGYLTKPFEVKTFIEKVEKYILE